MIEFISHGFDESLFWSITPRQYFIHMKAVAKRYKRQYEDNLFIAYQNAGLGRIDKMPPFEDLLPKAVEDDKAIDDDFANRAMISRLQAYSATLETMAWEDYLASKQSPVS